MTRPVTVPLLLVALLAADTLGAQRSAVFSSDALYASGASASCGASMQVTSRVAMHGASIGVLSAPMTSLARSVPLPVITGSVASPDRYRWGIQAGGALGDAGSCALRSDESRLWGTLSRRIGAGGLAVTVAGRSLSSVDPSRDRHGITAGAWADVRGTRLSLEVRQHNLKHTRWSYQMVRGGIDKIGISDTLVDTTYLRRLDSTSSRSDVRALDVRTRWQMAFGRLALEFTVGGTRSPAAGVGRDTGSLSARDSSRGRALQLWGRADARLAVGSTFELVGGLISLPASQTGALRSRRMATFGVGITGLPRAPRPSRAVPERAGATDAASFESVREDTTSARVRVRLPHATRVELSSELTAWQPLAMTTRGDGWWEATVRAPAGVYRLNLRVDGGAWTAPPGVPTVQDEFGGTVGLVPIG